MKMDTKTFLIQWTFLSLLPSLVQGFHTFSSLKVESDEDAQIAICQFTKTTEPTLETTAICGFKGESCSVAVYQNQSEAHVQKDVTCDCLEQVINDVDQAYHNIPAPDYSLAIDVQSGDTVNGQNIAATLKNGARLVTSAGHKYVELDGVDDYIDLGDNSNNCLGNVELCPSGLTLSVWVVPIQQSVRQWYFGTAHVERIGLVMRNENQYLWVSLKDTENHWISSSYQLISKWTLITVTWKKNGVLSVYIDGCLFEAVGFTANGNEETHDSRNTVIGKSTTASRWYAGIKLDEFMFWEKALESAEVMSVYISDY